MKVSIHQPSYFPWLGLLDKISQSNQFLLLDTVQLNDNAYQSRNLFLNHRGEIEYLIIPIQKKGYIQKKIQNLKTVDHRWQKKHKGFMIANYKKHPYFDEIYPQIEYIYEKKYIFLKDILLDSIYALNHLFEIKTAILFASDLETNHDLNKDDLILSYLQQLKASEYISGYGAKSYQNEKKFTASHIVLHYQSFTHPYYSQKNSSTFKQGLSALDLLFNVGRDHASLLLKGMQ